MPSKFTPEARETFLGAIGEGATVAEAAMRVGVAVQTAKGWISRGNREDGTDYAEFAKAVAGTREASATEVGDDDELVGHLWAAARRGSVRAIQLLLERPWERKRGNSSTDEVEKPKDPFADSDELSQRRRTRVA